MIDFNKGLFFLFMVMLSTIGLFASDMYLPALTEIQNFYHTDANMVGLSISIYLAGFSIGQLCYGAISDQIGRKVPLFMGLLLFLIATIGCIYANYIEVFLLCRFIQAIGVCAAYVLWQPIIVDLFDDSEAQKLLAVFIALNGLSPALSPIIGGFFTDYFGWHSIFLMLVVVTVIIMILTLFYYKESLKIQNRSEFSLTGIFNSYRFFLSERFFLGYAGAISFSTAMYLVFLTNLPFELSRIGYSAAEIGFLYLPIALTYMAGAAVAKSLHGRFGDKKVMQVGIFMAIIGSSILFIIPFISDIFSSWEIILPFSLVTFGNGFLVPTGTAYLIRYYNDKAGSCASALGFLVTTSAFVSTAISSIFIDTFAIYAMTVPIFILAIFMYSCFTWSYGYRYRVVE